MLQKIKCFISLLRNKAAEVLELVPTVALKTYSRKCYISGMSENRDKEEGSLVSEPSLLPLETEGF